MIFNTELQDEGGILEKGQTHDSNWNMVLIPTLEHYTNIVDVMREMRHPHHLENYYINYIGNSELNAVAFEKSDFEFIGIYPSLLLLVEDIFWAIWASPNVFPDYGTSTNTNSNNLDISLYIRRQPILFPKWGELRTNDNERWILSRQLARVANLFPFYHEINHIGRGHLLVPILNIESSRTLMLFEYPQKPYENFSRADVLQALEIDADEGATELLLDEILTYSNFLFTLLSAKSDGHFAG